MKCVREIRVPFQKNPDLIRIVSEKLGLPAADIGTVRIIKKSLDARKRHRLMLVYSVEVYMKGESAEKGFEPFQKLKWDGPPPIVIGAGPAGMFAAWTFLEHGISPVLLERGERTKERMQKVSRYWRYGELDPDSNVCNGEGGAGTFSDGKLVTRIKSPLIARVMQTFIGYGAPEEIAYVSDPHVGSNLIRKVIRRMNDDLTARGAKLRFNARVESLDLAGRDVQGVVLAGGERVNGTGVLIACGHSARSFFRTLHEQGVHCEPKPFALGLRIEHPQSYINSWQYGNRADEAELGPASYKVAHHWETENLGVYSFCMCPGGYVIPSASEADGIVVNGMSNYQRGSKWGSAAIVCSVPVERIEGEDVFRLMRFQEEIERKAFQMSRELGDPKKVPAQRLDDFLTRRPGERILNSSCLSGVVSANVAELLPDWIYGHLVEGIREIDNRRRGFAYPDAVLHAVESRTSSAVRITRDSVRMESVNTGGLFPCGEGAGYAGGITSAAIDGINSALAWIKKFRNYSGL